MVQVRGGERGQATGQAGPARQAGQRNAHHQGSQSRRFGQIPLQRQQLGGRGERRNRPHRHR